MAMRGVQRATLDADFILLADDLDVAHSILQSLGYRREFHSENVSHYMGMEPMLGRVDLLHAFRAATLGMLERAERLQLVPGCSIPVVHVEDLIGLKVQAVCNDPSRAISDWSDIHQLVESAGRANHPLDWELIEDYLDLFDQSHHLSTLHDFHGDAPPR